MKNIPQKSDGIHHSVMKIDSNFSHKLSRKNLNYAIIPLSEKRKTNIIRSHKNSCRNSAMKPPKRENKSNQLRRLSVAVAFLFLFSSVFAAELSIREALQKGSEHVQNGRYDEALKLYDDVLEREPESPVLMNAKGLVYKQRYEVHGNPEFLDMAVNAFKQALKINPRFVPSLYNLGMLYYSSDRKSYAAPYFKTLLEVFPDHPEKNEIEKMISDSELISNAADQPPRVTSTYPLNMARDVSPELKEIVVRFDTPMKNDSWTWAYESKDEFPELTGEPSFNDTRTVCRLPVSLKPDKTYIIWINSKEKSNFQNEKGIASAPYRLEFTTGSIGKQEQQPN